MPSQLTRRFKVYNKLLALLQSESVAKGLGMNLGGVYYSNVKMYKELREACHDGLTRIEISYCAADYQQEKEFYVKERLDRFEVDLDIATAALNAVEGICHEVPMATLLEHFQQVAKAKQFFVQMPHSVALVYARNDKAGSYCGFFKNISKWADFH